MFKRLLFLMSFLGMLGGNVYATSLTNNTNSAIRMVNYSFACKEGAGCPIKANKYEKNHDEHSLVQPGETQHNMWVGTDPNTDKENKIYKDKVVSKIISVEHTIVKDVVTSVTDVLFEWWCPICAKTINKDTQVVEHYTTDEVQKEIVHLVVPKCVPFGTNDTMMTGVQLLTKKNHPESLSSWRDVCLYNDAFPPNAKALYQWGRKGGSEHTSCDPVFVASSVEVSWEFIPNHGLDICCKYSPPTKGNINGLTIPDKIFPPYITEGGGNHRCMGLPDGMAKCTTKACKEKLKKICNTDKCKKMLKKIQSKTKIEDEAVDSVGDESIDAMIDVLMELSE